MPDQDTLIRIASSMAVSLSLPPGGGDVRQLILQKISGVTPSQAEIMVRQFDARGKSSEEAK